MKTFAETLKQNNNIAKCWFCKQDIWEYKGNYEGIIKAEDFIPISDDIPKPKATEEIRCPKCDIPLAIELKETDDGNNRSGGNE